MFRRFDCYLCVQNFAVAADPHKQHMEEDNNTPNHSFAPTSPLLVVPNPDSPDEDWEIPVGSQGGPPSEDQMYEPRGGSGSFLGKLASVKKWIGPYQNMNKQKQDVITPADPHSTRTADATLTADATHTVDATHTTTHISDFETEIGLLSERVNFLENQMTDVLGVLRAKQATPRHRIVQSRQTRQEFQDDSFFTSRMSDHSNEVRQQNIMIRKNRPVPFKADHTTNDVVAPPKDRKGA